MSMPDKITQCQVYYCTRTKCYVKCKIAIVIHHHQLLVLPPADNVIAFDPYFTSTWFAPISSNTIIIIVNIVVRI